MASPFTITSVSNYNSNPPSDDGAQTASNRVQWSTQKTKLADPIKTAFDTSETNTSAAFGKIVGGAGITTTAISYTVTSSDQGKFVKATASGITITTPDATVVGSPFVFSILNNSSGDITLDGNGSQTVDGSSSATIPAGCGCMLNTDGSNWFTDGQNFNNVLSMPQGRLTLTSGTAVVIADTAAGNVYYTPYIGDRVPISTDGTTFKVRQFSELNLQLVSNHLVSTIYDVFLFDNSGTITIGTGPAWNSSGNGSSSRGTGAGTTELQRVHGLWTNKNSMTTRNGATTYTVAANQGLYVGSILIDSSVSGQVTCHVSYGQARRWNCWNAYNRVPIYIKEGDPTASWSYTTNAFRSANNDSNNSVSILVGLQEERVDIEYRSLVQASSILNNQSTGGQIAIALNGSRVGTLGQFQFSQSTGGTVNTYNQPIVATHGDYLFGANQAVAQENGLGVTVATWLGTENSMKLSAHWRG